MDRKASMMFNAGNTIIRIFLLTAVFLSVVGFVAIFMSINLETRPVEAYVMMNRLLYSPNAITYVDPVTMQPYPGIIDESKFVAANDLGIYINKDIIAARLNLTKENAESKEIFYNEKYFKMLIPVAGKSGPGASSAYTENFNVKIKKSGSDELENGILAITVILSNS
jgi:hypothetical protein